MRYLNALISVYNEANFFSLDKLIYTSCAVPILVPSSDAVLASEFIYSNSVEPDIETSANAAVDNNATPAIADVESKYFLIKISLKDC